MGAQTSQLDPTSAAPKPNEFAKRVEEACQEPGDFGRFSEEWAKIRRTREERFPDYDDALCKEGEVLESVKFALKKQDPPEWRRKGIEIARTFLHLEKARAFLAKMDLITYLLVVTLPDENEEDEEDDDRGQDKERAEREKNIQLEVADTMRELAKHEEFRKSLCCTSVLNFLCIVLNQIEEARDVVTEIFARLSGSEEQEILALFMEDSVGDVLQSFFKTVEFKIVGGLERPDDDNDKKQWRRSTSALSNCARTLGTLVKHKHQVHVHKPRILEVFRYVVDLEGARTVGPHNMRLLAEMSRLFYWICRGSKDVTETLAEASESLDEALKVLKDVWEACGGASPSPSSSFPSITRGGGGEALLSGEAAEAVPEAGEGDAALGPDAARARHARACLCHTNCLLWVLLPEPRIRWKLKRLDVGRLHQAFGLRSAELRTVVLGTARHLLDSPPAQECHELVRFFGEQLLLLLDLARRGGLCGRGHEAAAPRVTTLLLDALSVLAMQRGMQEMLAEHDAWRLLRPLLEAPVAPRQSETELRRHRLPALLVTAQVAAHPGHRLAWVSRPGAPAPATAAPAPAAPAPVAPAAVVPAAQASPGSPGVPAPGSSLAGARAYPPREELEVQLNHLLEERDDTSSTTVGSLLLDMFAEKQFIESRFTTLFDWWREHSTSRYEEKQMAAEPEGDGRPEDARPLKDLIHTAVLRREERRALTSMETLRYCAPFECVLALSLFSRLALEPKFKRLIYDTALHSLLGCVCVGIWPEAREAAATLANLMWLPDLRDERLVCWLKLDGPRCIAVDAANVLIPVKEGSPRGADIGKGMYQSTWGVHFEKGSCVVLHPDGLRTHEVPGTLTSASPLSTFEDTSRGPYDWLDEARPDPRHFTVTCWFYWPPSPSKGNKVLLQASKEDRMSQVYLDCEKDHEGVWTLTTDQRTKRPLKTPKLNAGWHMLSLVSSTEKNKSDPFNGTRFFLDAWHHELKGVWVKNNFYMVGNDSGQEGRQPFGLITDFRIYARTLSSREISDMVQAKDTEHHPDQIVRRLAHMDAATILAQRLDVPDSATECLRALGSLATLASQRARIYSICGRQVLKMLDSPLPMVQRQAARLLNNIA